MDDDLLALTGAALIAALVLVLLPAAEVDLLLRLAVKSALHLLEALVHRLCRGVARQRQAVSVGSHGALAGQGQRGQRPLLRVREREEVADLLQAALYSLDRAAEGGLDAVCKGGHDPFAGLEEPRDRAGDGVLDVVQAVGEGGACVGELL